MKKILFLIPNLMHGGAEKVLVNLVNNLNERKYKISVCAVFDCGVNKSDLKTSIDYSGIFKKQFRGNIHFFKLWSRRGLYKKFIKGSYDIVISYLEGLTARAVSGCKDSCVKKICWIHIEQKDKKTVAQSFRSYRECVKAYNSFDKIVCVAETVKQDMQALIPLKTPCEVLYNTLETDDIKRLADAPIEFLLDNNKINVCVVGKLAVNKGCMRILKILKRLKDESIDKYAIYFLGIGQLQSAMEEYGKANGLIKDIHFLGYQTNPYKYVAKSDLLLCASLAEGFSTAATEALIVGTPVLTVKVSGMDEMLGSGEYGMIVDNDDEAIYNALKELSNKPEKLSAYKAKAKERGAYFSKENTINAVEDLLDNL